MLRLSVPSQVWDQRISNREGSKKKKKKSWREKSALECEMWAGPLRMPSSKLCLNSDGDRKAGPRLVESTFSQSGDRYLVCTGSSISFNLCFNFPSPVCFPLSSGHNPNITLQPPLPPPLSATSLPKPNQSKISPSFVSPPRDKLQYQHWHM